MRTGKTFDVRTFGAKGDGVVIDSPAINAAILAAEKAGGGMVILPPGNYLSFSVRLKSRVTLVLEKGATLIAAAKGELGQYDLPEERGPQLYQDFGHSYWHNSLIWADGAHDIAIIGKGRIDGVGLTRSGPGAPWSSRTGAGDGPLTMRGPVGGPPPPPRPAPDPARMAQARANMNGVANKAIALAHCKRVKLDGFDLFRGGHFGLLASEVDDMTITNLRIDTNRDGIDIDCVRRVRIENCKVNSPNDDAIVLKTSLGLGKVSPCEDIVIRNCEVTGFDIGSMLDGTRTTKQDLAPDRDRVTGRIKIGTESNGDFRNIKIVDNKFVRSRGLALETVDGGTIEDILCENLEMDDITTAPIFVRLGARLRGPDGTKPGRVNNVEIRNVRARGIDPRYSAIIAGLPDHKVECVQLRDIDLQYRGGFTGPVNPTPPEQTEGYPEPSMFGPTPAWGFWSRHATGIEVKRIKMSREAGAPADPRPPVQLDDTSVARTQDAQYFPKV